MTVILFCLSCSFVTYVLFGYPLLLGLWARLFPKAVGKRPTFKTVSILIAVRNGERWIGQKLQSIRELDYPRDLVEVIVISDGSDDATETIVEQLGQPAVQLIRIARSGKASALNAGIECSTGEILFFTDVRQPLDPLSLRNLVDCFADAKVGAASGELVILEGASHGEANVGLYWKYEKWIRKHLSQIDSVLGATGAIYAMRRELAVPLPPNAINDDVLLPLGAFFRGFRVIWDGSAKAYDYPTALESEFRRKARTLAGVYQSIAIYPDLLGPKNRMWVEFVSHKLGRLLVPYALLTIFGTSFFLSAPWPVIVLSSQGLFYALALADAWIPQQSVLKKLSSPLRTFVVLMAAALSATGILFLPGNIFWKETKVTEAKPVS